MGEGLGEFEQLVMLALLRLGDAAYGVAVHEQIERRTGRDVALGAVYKTLARLEAKGLVGAYTGEPTAERGGRRKRHYAILPAGRVALSRSITLIRRMSAGLAAAYELQ
jgi:PadR family transcriptional regulator, regulatory protein PadR